MFCTFLFLSQPVGAKKMSRYNFFPESKEVHWALIQTHRQANTQQVKSSIVAHQADHEDGPFGHTQQQTTKLKMQI
jgi:hypothetical protein